MKHQDTTHLLVISLCNLAAKHGYSVRSLAKEMGRPGIRNSLGPSRCHALKLDDAVAILEFLGEPPQALLPPTMTMGAPIRLLRKHRLALKPRSPDLRRWLRYRPRLSRVDDAFEIPPEIAEITDIGYEAPLHAIKYAERWINDILVRLEREETDLGILTLMSGLTSWAWLMRKLGHAADAAFAIEHAFQICAGHPPIGRVWIRLLYQAAFVLRDLGGIAGTRDALPLLQQGIGLAKLADDEPLLLTQCQGLVILARYVKAYELAQSAANSALSSAREPIDFLMLYQHLAVIHCDLDRPAQAQQFLLKIAELDIEPPVWTARHIAWTQGRIFAATGKLGEAAATFYELLEVEFPDPADHLLIFCDLAQTVEHLPEAPSLRRLAARSMHIAQRLEIGQALRQPIITFLENCQRDSVVMHQVEAARRSLARSRK